MVGTFTLLRHRGLVAALAAVSLLATRVSCSAPPAPISKPPCCFRDGAFTLMPQMRQLNWTHPANPVGSTFVGLNASVSFADLNRDGDPDMVVGDGTGRLRVFRRRAASPAQYTSLGTNGGVVVAGGSDGSISAWVGSGWSRDLFTVRNAHGTLPVRGLAFFGGMPNRVR